MRILIDRLPLQEEVCDECQVAFWRNIGFLDELLFIARSADKALMRHPAVPRRDPRAKGRATRRERGDGTPLHSVMEL
jgi:hypothetical protein